MKGDLVIFDSYLGRPAAARMVDGRLEDFLLTPPDTQALPGAIYRARVDRSVGSQGGAFVKLPDGSGYLRQARGLRPGDRVLVQVSGLAEPGKAVPLTTRLLFKGRHAIVTPGAPGVNLSRSIRDQHRRDQLLELAHDARDDSADAFGLILRSEAAGAPDDHIADEIQTLDALARAVMGDTAGDDALLLDGADAQDLAWRDWPSPDQVDERPGAFASQGVLDALDALWGANPLPGSGHVYVEATRAMIAIDVNTGGDTSPAAGQKANFAAARDLPRLLRLRGLGGQVVIDFAPMPKKQRVQLEQVLGAAFRADTVDTTLVGWTPLGHFELTRKRERPPLPREPG